MECVTGIGTSVLGKIGEYVVAPAGRHLGYVFHYKRNIDHLQNEIERLKDQKERVQHSVDEAIGKLEQIEADVEKWLHRACEVIEGAEEFIPNEDQANVRCRNRMIPDLLLRYQLSRKAKIMAREIFIMKDEGKFERVSFRPLGVENIIENKHYEAFETRKATLDGIMEALKNCDVDITGVYGMAGVGKTMLAKEVGRKALEEGLFKMVVMVTITQKPNLEKIQEEIGEHLGLQFEEKSISKRAKKLQDRLRKEKALLVILDDIWEKFDLQDAGISFRDDQKQCKILLTSRFQDVLSDDMNAKENIQIGVLSNDEAAGLFTKIVGDSMRNHEFRILATQIVRECAGLPIAISTVAYALRNKSLFIWKDALTQLQRSAPTNIKNMDKRVYSSIRLSFDFLESKEAQSLFLLCSLHEEDAQIDPDNLLSYGFGLGLFQHVYTLEEGRCRLYTLLNKLKACCLLLGGDDDWHVKMHDVTRDVGIMIASEERYMYYIRSEAELEKCLNEGKLTDSTAISLPHNYSSNLPEKLECKKLLLLRMGIAATLQIPSDLFEEMESLKVLDLSGSYLKPLPPSFHFLQNLHTLCLKKCVLEDVSVIGELANLQILDLSYSNSLEQLPKEIGQLTCLRILDLSFCRKLKVIHPNVISKLTHLEELNMKMTLELEWAVEGDSERSNACLAELKNLAQLKTLRLDIPYAHILPKDVFSDKLEIYEISIGFNGLPYILLDFRYEKVYSLMLKLKFKERSRLLEDHCLLRLMNRSEVLFLDELEGLEDNVVPDFNTNGFPQLKHLNFESNGTIKYIVDMRHIPSRSVFQRLESLTLESMKKLEKICHGKLTTESFHKLQVIKVSRCHNLKDLFSLSTAMCLSQLQTIEVSCCKMIEEVVLDDLQGANNEIFFPQFFSLRLFQAPKLSYFYSSLKASTSTLPLINKKLLPSPNLRNLKEVCVQDCGSLKYLFSSSVDANFEQLNRLEIRNCETMEEIISVDQRMSKLLFPNLRSLCLSQLPKVTRFSTGSYIELPLLNKLEIYKCPELATFLYTSTSTKMSTDTELRGKSKLNLCTGAKLALFGDKVLASNLTKLVMDECGSLKYLFSSSAAANFVQLSQLEISNCAMMEEIVSIDQQINKLLFPKLRHLSLSNLLKLSRFTGISIQFPLLTELCIKKCPQLRSFVYGYTRGRKELKEMKSEDGLCITLSLFNDAVLACNLTKFVIDECGSVKSLFSSSSAANFVQLSKLEISNCEMMEEVIGIDQKTERLLFPNLHHLILSNLSKITRFTGIFIEFPLLIELSMNDCPELKSFVYCSTSTNMSEDKELKERKSKDDLCSTALSLFNDMVAFPSLESIRVKRLDCLKSIWHGQPIADSFCKLELVEVWYCDSLLKVFPSNYMLRRFHNLRRFYIRPWKILDEVAYNSNLEELILVGSGSHNVTLCDLYKLIGQELNLEETCDVLFSRIKSLHLHASPTLMHLFEENSHPREVFKNLEDLLVWRCDSLKNVVPSSVSFPNLTSLSVSRCHGMVNLFSFSVARSLERLQKISIDECQMMTEIVSNDGGPAGAESLEITFNQLEVMELYRLPSLSSFYSGISSMRFPRLRKVVVVECPNMQNFCCMASMSLVGELPLMQPLESSHSCIAFHGLEILFVRRCDSLTNLIPFSVCFQNVTILRIAACNGMVSLLSCSTARYLSRLQTLSIIKCQRMQEVISNEWCDSDTGEIVFEQLETLALHKLPRLSSFHSGKFTVRFPKLKTVVVMQCPEVKSLRNVASPTIGDEIPLTYSFENFHLCEVFQKLETLDVGMCAKLMILAPPSISFSNLTRLRVSICSGMVYLLSFSIARSLARLKSMSISECQMMTQVIANEGDDLDGACEITFNQLEILELHSLPSLTSFHLGDCVIGFPKLKRLIVTQCPELKSFSCGAIVPKLDKIITRINDRYIRAQNFWNIKGYFEDLEQARPIQELWKDDFHSSMQELWEINLGMALQQLFREEDPKLEDPGEDPDNDFEEEEGFDNFSVF